MDLHPFPGLVLQYRYPEHRLSFLLNPPSRKISKYLSSWIVKSSLPKYALDITYDDAELSFDNNVDDIKDTDTNVLMDSLDCDSFDLTKFNQPVNSAPPVNSGGSHTQRIYAHWIHTGTATGRLSCKDPNLQNLPRAALVIPVGETDSDSEEKTFRVTVRDAFESRPGYSFFFCLCVVST